MCRCELSMMRYRRSHTAMVGFWVLWHVARSSPKEIKFQQSYAHTCAQGIILTTLSSVLNHSLFPRKKELRSTAQSAPDHDLAGLGIPTKPQICTYYFSICAVGNHLLIHILAFLSCFEVLLTCTTHPRFGRRPNLHNLK
jgi:hypothetical protein